MQARRPRQQSPRSARWGRWEPGLDSAGGLQQLALAPVRLACVFACAVRMPIMLLGVQRAGIHASISAQAALAAAHCGAGRAALSGYVRCRAASLAHPAASCFPCADACNAPHSGICIPLTVSGHARLDDGMLVKVGAVRRVVAWPVSFMACAVMPGHPKPRNVPVLAGAEREVAPECSL